MRVAKIDSKLVEEYERVLATDPDSRVFAVLGEIYREMGFFEKAETLLHRGITKHPDYATGYLVLAKLFLQRKGETEALQLLRRVVELSPDNLLAFQIMGEIYLQQKKPKEALNAYKMVLFLSPIHPRAQQMVRSLEGASGDEYEEEVFTLRAYNQELEEAPVSEPPRGKKLIEEKIRRLQGVLAALDSFR